MFLIIPFQLTRYPCQDDSIEKGNPLSWDGLYFRFGMTTISLSCLSSRTKVLQHLRLIDWVTSTSDQVKYKLVEITNINLGQPNKV